jgi:cold shock CspA family protein
MAEYIVKGIGEKKESKNGNQYCFIHIEGVNPFVQTFRALYFYKKFDLNIGDKVELDVKDGKDGQKIANKPRPNKSWGVGYSKAPTFDELKRLKSIELATQLVIADKVELADLEKIKKRLEEII